MCPAHRLIESVDVLIVVAKAKHQQTLTINTDNLCHLMSQSYASLRI